MLLKMLAAMTGLVYAFQTVTLTWEEGPTKSNYLHDKWNGMLEESANVDLQDYMNIWYYGSVQLGTPAVSYLMLFETRFSNLWVPASNCTNCAKSKTKYNPSASSTYQANGSSLDFDFLGSMKGYVAHDLLTIGDLQCEVDFAAVTKVPENILFKMTKFDGVFGLGWSNISLDGLTPLMQGLEDEKVIDSYMFGFYIQSDVHKTGKLTIGGYDKSKAKSIRWVPVETENSWSVNIQKLSFGGVSATKATSAIIDSGLPALVGPKDEVAAIAMQMGAKHSMNAYTVGCNVNLPDMEVKLGSDTHTTTLTVKGDDLRIKLCKFVIFCKCFLAIMGVDTPEPFWILGNVIMRDYYTIFDFGNAQIGFSALSTWDDDQVETGYKAAAY